MTFSLRNPGPTICASSSLAEDRNRMKILILGSGVIGTTAAYYLANAGHEVTVVDRQPGPALETSFANAGEVSPGYSAPWAGPGRADQGHQVAAHAPQPAGHLAHARPWHVALGRVDAAQLHRGALRVNKARMVRLAEYSRDCLRDLRADTGIAYDERSQGTLQLFRTQKQLDGIGKDIEILQQYGVPFELLDRAGYLQVEPALALVKEKFVGALAPAGRRDRRLLQVHAAPGRDGRGLGVKFRFGIDIEGITCAGGADHRRAHRRRHSRRPTAMCVALGSYSPLLLRAAGHRHAGLPGQGLFDHGADHRRRAARPNPPSWTRPTRSPSRAWATASASAAWRSWRATTSSLREAAPRDAGPCRQRPVPARRRRRAGPSSGPACAR